MDSAANREALLQRIEAASHELEMLIQRAQQLEVPWRVPLRAPVLEGLERQIALAKRFIAGEHIDRRRPENQRPGRATDYRP